MRTSRARRKMNTIVQIYKVLLIDKLQSKNKFGDSMQKRLHALDGLRGIAILTVAMYHYYVHFSAAGLYAWGRQLDFASLHHYSYYAVYLFFMISGFVIFMTLEKCRDMGEFIFRRWVRLFPAMLFASILILCISRNIPHYPFAQKILDALPGLTFTDHWIWSRLLHQKVESLDSVFWTLYVEVQFYILAAFIFYQLRKNLLPAMIILSATLGIAVQMHGVFFEKLSALTGLFSLCLP